MTELCFFHNILGTLGHKINEESNNAASLLSLSSLYRYWHTYNTPNTALYSQKFKQMFPKSHTVPSPSSLFSNLLFSFPFRSDGKIFYISTWRCVFGCILLLFCSTNTVVSMSFTKLSNKGLSNKLTFFYPSLAHSVSLVVCFIGVLYRRKMVNLPFLHFEIALTCLRSVGFIPKLKWPWHLNIVPYLVPLFLVLPDLLILELGAFRIITTLNDYFKVFFFYQILFKMLSFLKMLESVFDYCIESFHVLGDGIHYIGKKDKIESLINSYYQLCSCCTLINDLFSTNILMTVFVAFIGVIVEVERVIVAFQSYLDSDFLNRIVISVCLKLFSYCFLTWVLVDVCTSCVEKVILIVIYIYFI